MRKSKKSKRVIFFILLSLISYRYISLGKKMPINRVKHNENEIEIHMIDVGQSEAIMIIQGENTILIDTGGIFSGKVIVDYALKVGVNNIDYLILTHFHNDHIGGVHKIISSLNVENIICMESRYFSSLQERFWFIDMKISKKFNELLYAKRINLESPYDDNENLKKFSLGNSEIIFLSQENDTNIVNNKSIIIKVVFGNFSALFMADVESEVEEKLIMDEVDINVKILKVGHHGSNTSSTSKFLELVNPEFALISCGEDNEYLHPHDSVLKRLNKRNVKVYRTDVMGNIVVNSNGNDIWVSTDK